MTRRHVLALTAAAQTLRAQTPEQAARNEDFWFQTRLAFSVDRNLLNFNNGSLCPAPIAVQQAMERYWTVTNLSPSHYVDQLLIPETEVVRGELARDFGCSGEELALTRNTSEGLHTVIYGLDLKAGDEVLTTTQDYPSMISSLEQRARRDGIVLRRFAYPSPPKSPRQLADLFWERATSKTRAILVSHMTFTTGQIFPVADICREARKRGIYSIVDGAHGFAHLVFRRDDLDCDFYATSLHKWLTAPVGTGFLYVRRELIPKVWPLMGAPASMAGDIRKFESVGTQPVAMRNAIADALAFHRGLGPERKQERLRYLRRRWSEPLSRNARIRLRVSDDPAQSCGIGALSIDGIAATRITETLEQKYRIHVRTRVIADEFDCIRVSPNIYHSPDEVDRFTEAILQIARS
ncbi:aminotransferase class V-fold PLP-dependent enzyme [uncultured Paludibaculum sp.]|uniref:aminotransferase class V-fold PLP-dependent enzyme n=1 Tax=uncultured Paludibaculum sp. TaxID=1765020 RepID=UPI002AAC196B|nr:aminotransferase class V-fold PLP-dependent enzyme [uncultured Paludibaculum sp.]